MTGGGGEEEIEVYLSLVEQRYTKTLFFCVSLHLLVKETKKRKTDVVINTHVISVSTWRNIEKVTMSTAFGRLIMR